MGGNGGGGGGRSWRSHCRSSRLDKHTSFEHKHLRGGGRGRGGGAGAGGDGARPDARHAVGGGGGGTGGVDGEQRSSHGEWSSHLMMIALIRQMFDACDIRSVQNVSKRVRVSPVRVWDSIWVQLNIDTCSCPSYISSLLKSTDRNPKVNPPSRPPYIVRRRSRCQDTLHSHIVHRRCRSQDALH
jgi:hypothetical protein